MATSLTRPRSDPCFQCRTRKVRCDRKFDICSNCERLKYTCSFQKSASRSENSQRRNEDEPDRRRAARACLRCRAQKSRCSGEMPQCDNCQRRHRDCHYPGSKRAGTFLRKGTDHASSAESHQKCTSPLQSKQELIKFLDLYFQYLYPLPGYSFLHESSIRRMYSEERLEESLVLAICAIVNLRCPSSGRVSYDSASWIARAESRILNQLERPSIFHLQALFLIIHYHAEVGGFGRAFMLASLASRQVTALRLNHESPRLGFVAQETRRRAAWTMALLDGYFSVGLPGYSTIDYGEIYQQFPCREEMFGSPIPECMIRRPSGIPTDQSPASHGTLELILRLSKVRRDIIRLTRQLALVEQPVVDLDAIARGFQTSLLQIGAQITASFGTPSPSHAKLQSQTQLPSRWLGRVLEIRVAWHQGQCDLSRIFLAGHPNAASLTILNSLSSSPFVLQAREKCHQHSTCIIDFILHNEALIPPTFFSVDIARCVYHAARLCLHLAGDSGRKGSGDSLSLPLGTALERASLAVAFLQRNFGRAAHAKGMILDLEVLIEACSSPQSKEARGSNPDRLAGSDGFERHHQLAVHSLLHQAEFVDDSYLYDG
ncbi:hypothetical protein BO99DRAFT_174027 [Aspergillus violaceofuscus CBS 115571]|uniref:Zn(2)-C6 fungal-type domain-containing protein n=1 Tax=Aspergillus violaceofuscus (strain CBS 115571) TaxID=1450538 RepID=A0A2V5HP94_ASPV1|nr:hypothetical protein BO99DRAFT_174027 [Aspergillus violaceofuscus CBS 115571]